MTTTAKLTTRGWVALGVAVAVLVAGTVAVLAYRIFGGHACEVTAAGRTVSLDRDEAVRVTTAVAEAQRRRPGQAGAVVAVARTLDLSAADTRAVAAATGGQARAALTCHGGGADDTASDRLGADGLTARAERVRRDLGRRFGDVPLGGFAPGGVRTGHMPGSAHYEGRAIDVFFRPISARSKTRGWALAHYLVANAERLEIDTVIYDGRIWTARRSFQGWRDYHVSHAGRSAATVRILEHRDHVHVDVAD
ncbi:hypothetical protein [Marmoricola sp. RAF53]|uniref:hypothetical protein n=1 Tax=Marmoricola sp. RAF53 TaxID=3233059 RepID=UPI003F9E6A09